MKEFWNQRYSEATYAYGTEPNDFLASADLSSFSGKVLCIAEGEGRNAVYLAGLGFDVTATDQSEEGLKKAAALAAQKNVNLHTVCCDILDFDFGTQQWDGIVSIFGHLPAAVRNVVHNHIKTAIKPGGFLLMEAYDTAQLKYESGGPKDPDMLFDLEDLDADFSDAFEWMHLTQLQREVSEGGYHTGMASVVQAFGIKNP